MRKFADRQWLYSLAIHCVCSVVLAGVLHNVVSFLHKVSVLTFHLQHFFYPFTFLLVAGCFTTLFDLPRSLPRPLLFAQLVLCQSLISVCTSLLNPSFVEGALPTYRSTDWVPTLVLAIFATHMETPTFDKSIKIPMVWVWSLFCFLQSNNIYTQFFMQFLLVRVSTRSIYQIFTRFLLVLKQQQHR